MRKKSTYLLEKYHLPFKSVVFCLFTVLFTIGCSSTQKVGETNKSNRKIIRQLAVDNLQNVFVLYEDESIIMYDKNKTFLYEFNNKSSGSIYSIDVTNPQKIVCFIKDFNRIIILDNTLAEIKSIDLSISNHLDVSAVARSNDNLFWIFDPVKQLLVKVDEFGKTIMESNRLSDYNLDAIDPTSILERDNKVLLVDKKYGILVFDNFGQFIKLIPEENAECVQYVDPYVFFSQGDSFYQYHMTRYEKLPFVIEGAESLYNKFYLGKKNNYLYNRNSYMAISR